MSNITIRPVARLGFGDYSQLILNIAAAIGMAAIIWASLIYAKSAVNLAGDEQVAQRIFYLHMGCNGSVIYLITRSLDWDRVTQASIEAGTLFGIGTIVTGIFWSKPTWNTYWTWDPRLTTSTITVLIYLAYMLFRNGIDNRNTRARFGSIYALLAFLTVPLTYYSARWFRSIHPIVFDGNNTEAEGGFSIGVTMGQTLAIATISFCLLYSALMIMRWRQLRLEDNVAELRRELM